MDVEEKYKIRDQLMKAIRNEDKESVEKLIDQLSEMNTRDPENTKLPNGMEFTSMTRPLQLSIANSNWHSVKYILSSSIVTNTARSVALEEIFLSTVLLHSKDTLPFIHNLIQHGAVVQNLTLMATILQKSITIDLTLFQELIKAFLDHGNNLQKGFLLLSFNRNCDLNPWLGCGIRRVSPYEWKETKEKCLSQIFVNGFDPYLFMKESHKGVYNNTPVMQSLPKLLVMSTVVDNYTVAKIIYRSTFHYPVVDIESKDTMKLLCLILLILGYDITLINDIAKTPRQFNDGLQLIKSINNIELCSLQDMCRKIIRTSINESNVLLGIRKMSLPAQFERHCMMTDLNGVIEEYKKGFRES